MNSGVYCRQKAAGKLYNAILIDQYRKCIFGAPTGEGNRMQVDNTDMDSLGPSPSSANSSEEEKWESGMNVRARFSEDGEYYEAVIEKIFDDYAVVRYLGYGNEEAVKLQELRPSRGEESIGEQLKRAEEHMDEDEEYEDEEFEESEEIDWKPGMNCRALYEPNEVVYEAMIQEVSEKDRKAVVVMIGYGVPYEVSFDNMYESIDELRLKQEATARTYLAAKQGNTSCAPNPLLGGGSKPGPEPMLDLRNSSKEYYVIPPRYHNFPLDNDVPPPHIPKPQAPDMVFPQPCANDTAANSAASCMFSQFQGMLQPQSENDALACMTSSTYLSGYYAGYYDCLKNLNREKHPQ